MEWSADPREDGRWHCRPQAKRLLASVETRTSAWAPADDRLACPAAKGALTQDELDELGHLVWQSWWSSRTGKATAAAIGCTGVTGESQRACKEGPSQCEAFDPVVKKLRDAAIRSLAESYLDHANANGGKCKRGFVEVLVDQARISAQGLGITREDIIDEVKRMQKSRTDSRAALISPAETSNAAPPSSSLDLLASAVSQVSPRVPQEGGWKARAEAERARQWAWRAAQSVQRAAARSEEERQAKNARERARYKARRAAQSKEEWEAENAKKRARRAALLEG